VVVVADRGRRAAADRYRDSPPGRVIPIRGKRPRCAPRARIVRGGVELTSKHAPVVDDERAHSWARRPARAVAHAPGPRALAAAQRTKRGIVVRNV
jgi:hypothetical protein